MPGLTAEGGGYHHASQFGSLQLSIPLKHAQA
jgi:hypothetical protein